MRSYKQEVWRFVAAGIVNTGAGYLIYFAALWFVPYRIAYTISYALGIIISYAINTLFVFGEPWSWKRLAGYPLVYVLQYGVGFVALSLLVENLGISVLLAPILVIAVTLPVTFLASRYLIKGKFR